MERWGLYSATQFNAECGVRIIYFAFRTWLADTQTITTPGIARGWPVKRSGGIPS